MCARNMCLIVTAGIAASACPQHKTWQPSIDNGNARSANRHQVHTMQNGPSEQAGSEHHGCNKVISVSIVNVRPAFTADYHTPGVVADV